MKKLNEIDKILANALPNKRLRIQKLDCLGHSLPVILKRIEYAFSKSISLYLVEEKVLISKENIELQAIFLSMLRIEKSYRNKKAKTAKESRLKNGTKLGRKSGRKAKSMFDRYKIKIMKLYSLGIPKTKILEQIKQKDGNLKNTSPQARGQYIKKIKTANLRKKLKKDIANVQKKIKSKE
jgi:hypothetical protein